MAARNGRLSCKDSFIVGFMLRFMSVSESWIYLTRLNRIVIKPIFTHFCVGLIEQNFHCPASLLQCEKGTSPIKSVTSQQLTKLPFSARCTMPIINFTRSKNFTCISLTLLALIIFIAFQALVGFYFLIGIRSSTFGKVHYYVRFINRWKLVNFRKGSPLSTTFNFFFH
jgi:hypothetical protein